ncbi:Cyclic nucleotide-binding protein [Pseudocohnilembus persalinus]|uniref:Cyclic nucleotide-binding protein n=1 Tax=Pseudocohnilembus persalinus TaxID=266149 RepID=A0A0V0QT68_PSEPJ|nr:Cyclic nucleotide-binding protein [Pseudocohnilembus persalinus]|eukprot:KRX05577.1 Cyclic nucleotide-binding protein [Pseudocohnilembus persalinus]
MQTQLEKIIESDQMEQSNQVYYNGHDKKQDEVCRKQLLEFEQNLEKNIDDVDLFEDLVRNKRIREKKSLYDQFKKLFFEYLQNVNDMVKKQLLDQEEEFEENLDLFISNSELREFKKGDILDLYDDQNQENENDKENEKEKENQQNFNQNQSQQLVNQSTANQDLVFKKNKIESYKNARVYIILDGNVAVWNRINSQDLDQIKDVYQQIIKNNENNNNISSSDNNNYEEKSDNQKEYDSNRNEYDEIFEGNKELNKEQKIMKSLFQLTKYKFQKSQILPKKKQLESLLFEAENKGEKLGENGQIFYDGKICSYFVSDIYRNQDIIGEEISSILGREEVIENKSFIYQCLNDSLVLEVKAQYYAKLLNIDTFKTNQILDQFQSQMFKKKNIKFDIGAISARCKPIVIDEGKFIYKQGDLADKLFILDKGVVSVFKEVEQQQNQQVQNNQNQNQQQQHASPLRSKKQSLDMIDEQVSEIQKKEIQVEKINQDDNLL